MAGCCDCDGTSHLPAVPALRAQVDCARTPPVDCALRIHCMVDVGLIHVEGEGGGSICIIDDGNNLLEETVDLVAHFLGGVLRGVRGHAVDESVFPHKARNGCFLGRESLGGKNRTQVGGLADEA
jgi:hypothetical protein